MPNPQTPREIVEYYFGQENKGMYPAEIGKWNNQVSMDKFISALQLWIGSYKRECCAGLNCECVSQYNQALQTLIDEMKERKKE